MTAHYRNAVPNVPFALRRGLWVTLIGVTIALGACVGVPSTTQNSVVEYHEAADGYLRACLSAQHDCNESAEAHVKGLFTHAWQVARYQRGTRAYLRQHDRIWTETLCGLRDEQGCSVNNYNALAPMEALEGLDRREYR